MSQLSPRDNLLATEIIPRLKAQQQPSMDCEKSGCTDAAIGLVCRSKHESKSYIQKIPCCSYHLSEAWLRRASVCNFIVIQQ